MIAMGDRIQLAHGGGGTLMQQLIDQELRALFADPAQVLHDAARLELPPGPLAFSTDGYVVQPLEFPGGDIGSLAVTGTANDLAMAGARPHHLSVGPIAPTAIRPGDQLLVSGDLGRHGVAILAARHGLHLVPPVLSDCAPLWPQVQALLAAGVRIHCLRDLTRGGLASALQELADASGVELAIEEARLPVVEPVARTCDLLGFEPLHLANEGRFVAVVPPQACAAARALMEADGGAWIGTVRPAGGAGARVVLSTVFGTERLLVPLSGELLPRIC